MKETRFKDTEIGRIPEDWDEVKILEVSSITTGATPSTEMKTYWEGGNIRWMSSGELNNKEIFEVSGRITQEGYDHSGTHMIPKMCVLIGLAGQGKTRGTAAINYVELCTNQSIAAILPNITRFNSKYLYYYIDSQYKALRLLSAGDGGRGGLNKQILLNIKFPMPESLKEQARIASALSSIDNLISSLDKLIEKKKNIKQGTMQQLLTGKKRLKGFTEPWENIPLGKLCSLYGRIGFRGYTKADLVEKHQGAITYSPSDINDQILDNSNCDYISLAKYEESPEIKVFNGDILFCKTASIGKCAIVQGLSEKATINPQFVVLKDFKCENVFLYYILAFSDFQDRVKAITGGSTIPTMSQEKLKQQIIFLPSQLEQRAISSILASMDKEISVLKGKKAKYESIKQGMMQQLLTGKIRLL